MYVPGSTPLLDTSDFSNSDKNLFTSSGFSGGTLIGAFAPGVGLVVPASRGFGVASTTIPSNLGRGPAATVNHVSKSCILIIYCSMSGTRTGT